MSMATSKIRPRKQETIFDSPCGGCWKCRPRKVSADTFVERFSCTTRKGSPASANSASQKVRTKSPRSSRRLSTSIMVTPSILVGTNRIASENGERGYRGDELAAAFTERRILGDNLVP